MVISLGEKNREYDTIARKWAYQVGQNAKSNSTIEQQKHELKKLAKQMREMSDLINSNPSNKMVAMLHEDNQTFLKVQLSASNRKRLFFAKKAQFLENALKRKAESEDVEGELARPMKKARKTKSMPSAN
uniref:Uncharacterized protein n=1 Tax=Ditylenchus dipsaci TaxID=166011 RepID=A0A915EQ93_9BILA